MSWHQLGHRLEETGRHEQARNAYGEFITLSEQLREELPEEEKYKGWLAEGYFHRASLECDPARKVADFTRAHELRPDQWSYLPLRADVYSELKDYRRAMDDFGAALKLIASDKEPSAAADVYWHRGRVYI